MWNALKTTFGKQTLATGKRTRPRTRRLVAERLEIRALMSGTPNSFTFADNFESADVAAWQVHLNKDGGFNVPGTGAYKEIGSGKSIQLVDADRGKALKITYEKNEDRGQAVVYIPGAEYVRTKQSMKFGDTFDFAAGQKIHRIWGMDAAGERSTFDVVVLVWAKPLPGRPEGDYTGTNESQQVSINANGGVNDWGGDWADFTFERGRWYDIVTEIKLNDIGQSNGEARVWIDGVKVVEKTGIVIRNEATVVANRVLFGGWYSNSWGGANPAVDPASPSSLWIDDVSIQTTPAAPPPPPPPPPAAPPRVSVSDMSIVEGTSATGVVKNAEFEVSLAADETDFAPVTLDYATADGTAIAGADYSARSGAITLTAANRTAKIVVPIIGDNLKEANEEFFVRLSNVRGGEVADAEGVGTIADDDATAGGFTFADNFESADVAAWQAHLNSPGGFNHRGTGGFREIGDGPAIRLVDADRGKALKVTYTKNEDRGQAVVYIPDGGAEYVRTKQSMKFSDTFDFGGAKIHRIWGMDAADERATFDVIVGVTPKPLPGRQERDFTGTNDMAQISVNYNGGPHDWGADWADFSFQRGRWYDVVTELKLNDVGKSNGEVRVWIDGVKVLEKAGIFIRDEATDVANRVLFGGWYSNSWAGANPAIDPATPSSLWIDDVSIQTTPAAPPPPPPPVAPPQVSISDMSIVEGTSATGVVKNAEFVVSLATKETNFAPVTLDYTTGDGTATAGADYTARSGAITLTATTRTARILVPIIGDNLKEQNEQFFVRLSNPRGGTIADAEGIGTIVNDDTPPTLAVSDVTIVEGTGPRGRTRNAVFVVHVTSPETSFANVQVNYATIDGTAKAGSDYVARRGLLTLSPSRRSATISIPVFSDSIREANENFSVRLSNAINATIADGVGIATIVDDDRATRAAAFASWLADDEKKPTVSNQ